MPGTALDRISCLASECASEICSEVGRRRRVGAADLGSIIESLQAEATSSTYAEVATVLHSRLLHLDDLAAACRQLEPSLHRPYLTPWHPLPDLPDPALIRTLQGHTDRVTACTVSPNGMWIVSASWDNTLKLWGARTGACLTTLYVDGQLDDCAFCPDGEHLVAVGQKGVYFLRVVR